MRTLTVILALATLVLAGCKSQYWVWAEKDEPIIAANDTPENAPPVEPAPDQPEPEPEPQAPKEIIFVLGIDGMD
ncbi:MAG: hypothetical protein IPK87_11640 [Planctomycetes bacterium]|nr:hypothetical protein [Planctomycetota bacterium]